jgi:hypothetical protein
MSFAIFQEGKTVIAHKGQVVGGCPVDGKVKVNEHETFETFKASRGLQQAAFKIIKCQVKKGRICPVTLDGR